MRDGDLIYLEIVVSAVLVSTNETESSIYEELHD